MNDYWMMWMIRTVSPLRALSPGVLRRWYKPSWVTLKQMMNDFRMKWNESYRSFSIMDSMTAKWDFVLGMTPKTPEWCQNEWSDRNFLTKGLWLEFLKSSALDQSEASILGFWPIGILDFGPFKFDFGLKIFSFLSFQPNSGHFGVISEKQSQFAVISFISSFSNLSLIPMIPEWCEWVIPQSFHNGSDDGKMRFRPRNDSKNAWMMPK